MIRICLLACVCAVSSTATYAKCPATPPSFNVNFDSADKRVNAAWLEKNLDGRRVKFDDGTEHYQNDGTYSYKTGSQKWDAPSYKFYNTGLRCIGYLNPRYDMYVVNNGNLVLINSNGSRFTGKLLK